MVIVRMFVGDKRIFSWGQSEWIFLVHQSRRQNNVKSKLLCSVQNKICFHVFYTVMERCGNLACITVK